jgi:hypothetical protein
VVILRFSHIFLIMRHPFPKPHEKRITLLMDLQNSRTHRIILTLLGMVQVVVANRVNMYYSILTSAANHYCEHPLLAAQDAMPFLLILE